jgi:hypothetical protein
MCAWFLSTCFFSAWFMSCLIPIWLIPACMIPVCLTLVWMIAVCLTLYSSLYWCSLLSGSCPYSYTILLFNTCLLTYSFHIPASFLWFLAYWTRLECKIFVYCLPLVCFLLP